LDGIARDDASPRLALKLQGDAPAGAGEGETGPAPELLGIEGIWKSFGNQPVLRNVGLSIRQGEFVTLLGPSGCGKTTLLRIVAGLELADRGAVRLHGEDIAGLPANQRPINTVFQNYALFPHLNVFENVAFGLRSRKLPQAQIDRRVHDALEMLQLDEYRARRTHQLSGGQKQRVALARALVNQPELLLLDEPMSALDAKLRAEVQLELRRLQRRLGKTFIMVTHDQDEAMTVSDRIAVMREGWIEQCGPPPEVYSRPVNRFVAAFLGSANMIQASGADGAMHTSLGQLRTRNRPAWQTGTLAIRPEAIRLCSQRPASNGVHGEVRELVYRGGHVDVFFEPGALRVRTSSDARLAVGERVWLELPEESLEALSD
jgi:spermidine/putrescine transport system ATP-binding protein